MGIDFRVKVLTKDHFEFQNLKTSGWRYYPTNTTLNCQNIRYYHFQLPKLDFLVKVLPKHHFKLTKYENQTCSKTANQIISQHISKQWIVVNNRTQATPCFGFRWLSTEVTQWSWPSGTLLAKRGHYSAHHDDNDRVLRWWDDDGIWWSCWWASWILDTVVRQAAECDIRKPGFFSLYCWYRNRYRKNLVPEKVSESDGCTYNVKVSTNICKHLCNIWQKHLCWCLWWQKTIL